MRGIFEFDRDAPTKDCPQFFEKNCDDDRHCAPPTLDSALNFLLSCHHRTYSGDPFICVTNAKISEVSLVQPMVQIESKTLRWFIYITCCTMNHRNKSGDDNDGEPHLAGQQWNKSGNDGGRYHNKKARITPGLCIFLHSKITNIRSLIRRYRI